MRRLVCVCSTGDGNASDDILPCRSNEASQQRLGCKHMFTHLPQKKLLIVQHSKMDRLSEEPLFTPPLSLLKLMDFPLAAHLYCLMHNNVSDEPDVAKKVTRRLIDGSAVDGYEHMEQGG